MYSSHEILSYCHDTEIILKGNAHDPISILGFPLASITTCGLKFDVTDYALNFEKCCSISNAFVRDTASIKITGDILLIQQNKT